MAILMSNDQSYIKRPIGYVDPRLRRPPGAWLLVGLLLQLLVRPAPLHAGNEMPVPVDIQVPLLMKILSADRALPGRAGRSLVIGVVFQDNNRESSATMSEFTRLAADAQVSGSTAMPVTIEPVRLEKLDALASELAKRKVRVCYITPLRSVDVGAIIAAADSSGSLTCTGVPEYMKSGVAVGIGSRGDRPEIIINIDSAREAGADFSSQLLKLARVVSKGGDE
ncbi:MAG: YfiR family protein [Candidatus Zixiibacteriota bacterium]